MHTRLQLTIRGFTVLILGVAAVWGATLIALPDLAYVGCILLALLAMSLLSHFIARGFRALTRTVSSEILSVGHTSDIVVHVRAQSLLPTAPGWWQDTTPDAVIAHASGPFPAIESSVNHGEQTMTVHYLVEGLRRGVHQIGPFRVSITDPFGLVRYHRIFTATTPVTIAPALVALAALPSSAGEAGGSLHSSTSHLGEGADNLIARPYAPGDAMRRIHWRATAHRGELMVRQEEKESTPRALVILDRALHRWAVKAGQSDAKDPAFETMLSLCISVAARLFFEGYLVHVVDQDGTELCDPLVEEADITGMRAAFATHTARGSDHTDSLRLLVPDGDSGPLVLVTSKLTLDDAAAIGPLAHSSPFAVIFATDSATEPLAICNEMGWRTSAVAAAPAELRDDAVHNAWITALQRGVSRVAW